MYTELVKVSLVETLGRVASFVLSGEWLDLDECPHEEKISGKRNTYSYPSTVELISFVCGKWGMCFCVDASQSVMDGLRCSLVTVLP